MEITKEMFLKYEGVRVSRITNMCAINTVSQISELKREECLEIMNNYSDLQKEFLGGKND